MSERAEKLVEEIGNILDARCMMRLDGFDAFAPMAGIYEAERRQRILAKELIALIGQAYADGMPLPGEVGRIEGKKLRHLLHYYRHTIPWFREIKLKDAASIIALSPSGIPVEHKEGTREDG